MGFFHVVGLNVGEMTRRKKLLKIVSAPLSVLNALYVPAPSPTRAKENGPLSIHAPRCDRFVGASVNNPDHEKAIRVASANGSSPTETQQRQRGNLSIKPPPQPAKLFCLIIYLLQSVSNLVFNIRIEVILHRITP